MKMNHFERVLEANGFAKVNGNWEIEVEESNTGETLRFRAEEAENDWNIVFLIIVEVQQVGGEEYIDYSEAVLFEEWLQCFE